MDKRTHGFSTHPDGKRLPQDGETAAQAGIEAFEMPEFVASATECTGLSPDAVLSEQEAEAYAQLYGILPQKPSDPMGPAQP